MEKFGLKIIPYSEENWFISDGQIVAYKWMIPLTLVYSFELSLFYIFGYADRILLITFLVAMLWEVLKGVYACPGFSIRNAIVSVYAVIAAGIDWQIYRFLDIVS